MTLEERALVSTVPSLLRKEVTTKQRLQAAAAAHQRGGGGGGGGGLNVMQPASLFNNKYNATI